MFVSRLAADLSLVTGPEMSARIASKSVLFTWAMLSSLARRAGPIRLWLCSLVRTRLTWDGAFLLCDASLYDPLLP